MKHGVLKIATVAGIIAIIAGCSSDGNIDELQSQVVSLSTRVNQLEQSTNRTDAKVDQALQKIDRMSQMNYGK